MLEKRIIFPADPSGKSIVDNDRAAMDQPPVDRAAEIGGQQIIFMGNILEIAELE